MNLYVIRHGEAENNIDVSVYRDTSNHEIDLTGHGILQAETAAKKLDVSLRGSAYAARAPLIFTSPYQRSKRTAQIIASRVKCSDIIVSSLLAEQNYGLATGYESHEKYAQKYVEQEQLLFKMGKMFSKLPQGESLADVGLRANIFLLRMLHNTSVNVIVVSHLVFCSMLDCEIQGKYPSILKWDNCEIRLYEDIGPWFKYVKHI